MFLSPPGATGFCIPPSDFMPLVCIIVQSNVKQRYLGLTKYHAVKTYPVPKYYATWRRIGEWRYGSIHS